MADQSTDPVRITFGSEPTMQGFLPSSLSVVLQLQIPGPTTKNFRKSCFAMENRRYQSFFIQKLKWKYGYIGYSAIMDPS